jgi:thioredoxin 1
MQTTSLTGNRSARLRAALLLVALPGVCLLMALGCQQAEEPNSSAPAPSNSSVDTSADNNKATAANGLPRLLDLGATKCIPCKMMAPILEELKEQYAGSLEVDFVDVWENPAAAAEYGIESIPTQIFFDASGKELFRHMGFISKEDILAKWKELGVDLPNKSADAAPDT